MSAARAGAESSVTHRGVVGVCAGGQEMPWAEEELANQGGNFPTQAEPTGSTWAMLPPPPAWDKGPTVHMCFL
jgi:hypothetical protein